jgi:DNA helicase-2/ATP-dependent DNA helicase PcrA
MSQAPFDFGSLTPEQRAVVEHPLGQPALVDAGAGTGKTHTIVSRVVYLHTSGQCEAKHLLLLTFARKAAAELRRRVLDVLGAEVEPPHCSTFHAFAAGVLSQHAYELKVSPDATVIEDIDARLEFRDAFDEVVYGSDVDASALPLRPVQRDSLRDGLFAIAQQLKEHEITTERFLERALVAADEIERLPARAIRPRAKDPRQQRKALVETTDAELKAEAEDARARARAAAEIFRRYYARLERKHALTYADLLLLARRGIARDANLFRHLRGLYRHCIVDEFQDTDDAQWRFLQTLFGDQLEGVTVVGDPRQSIFGFRGAKPENVRNFGTLTRGARYTLAENRRSRQEILDLAHAIVRDQLDADDLPLRAHRGAAGAQVVHVLSRWADDESPRPNADANREAQARAVAERIASLLAHGRAPRDIAILTRNKTLIQPFTAALNERGLPFRLLGGAGFYEASEIRDMMAWLVLLADPLDGQAAARLAASPACGLSDATTAILVRGLDKDPTAFARRLLVEPLPDTLDADSRARIERLRGVVDRIEPYATASLAVALPAVLAQIGLIERYESAGDNQAAANLRKLVRLASDFLARDREAKVADFVHYIEELERIEFDDREADSPASDAVTIMTVHAAKGLEWPVVFVVDVWPQSKPAPLIRLDLETGALLCREGRDDSRLFHFEWARLQPDTDGSIPHEDEIEKGPSPEERRLFYVALTRARDEVYVLGGRRYSGKKPLGDPHVFVAETEMHVDARGWLQDDPAPAAPHVVPKQAPALEPPRAEQTELWGGQVVPELRSQDPRAQEHGTTSRASLDTLHSALPPLSFSTLHAFERCPRSVTYKVSLRLPNVRPDPRSTGDDALDDAALDLSETGSLLASSDYGRLVHRALESWARNKAQGGQAGTPETLVSAAARDLDVHPKAAQQAKAANDVRAAIGALAGWTIEHVEAPFSLQFGDVVVGGYIDLIARDATGRAVLVDYKTGETAATEYVLQLGIYRDAVERAYHLPGAACFIGRFSDAGFALEPLDVPAPDEVRARIAAVAKGLRERDVTPRPGRWCYTCAYRAAPCDAYPTSKQAI